MGSLILSIPVFLSTKVTHINPYFIKPDFIREDEAFQELLQYSIITGDYT